MAGKKQQRGFSLIELLVVIVVIGILAGVAMQSMTATVKDLKRIRTEREMEMLSRAIVGDPSLTQNGARSDFGYVGDVGAFPSDLQALFQNPGGLSTWNGPYLPATFAQDSTGFKTDEWGRAYVYAGGLTMSSTGGGTTLTKKIADATSDYLLNRITGNITDAGGAPPGAVYDDSINVVITYPNGAGGTAAKTYHPIASGDFTLDSIPVGTHSLQIVYTPDNDTLHRYVTVLPRHRGEVAYQLGSTLSGGGPAGTSTLIIRPNGPGTITNLTRSGCSANYQCGQETTADGGASVVIRADNSFATDVYALENPSVGTGTIQRVTVYCVAMKSQVLGEVQLVVYTSGAEYRGATYNLIVSFAEYSESWTTNPSGGQWAWPDITGLEAGIRLNGQNSQFPAYCTQVWVEVEYQP